jgi:hypothetical protein
MQRKKFFLNTLLLLSTFITMFIECGDMYFVKPLSRIPQ